MRILLQFPEGLKPKALAYAKKLEAQGDEVVISASPSFGACDLAIDEAKKIGAQRLVHFGHAEFCKADFNVQYVEYPIDADLGILKESLALLNGCKKLCLLTTIQHVHQLQDIAKFFESEGKEIVLNTPSGQAKHKGQILGCDPGDVSELDEQVDAFVYFGGGLFHPLGALLQTTKPFLVIDPFMRKVEFIDGMRTDYKKRSMGRILVSLEAKAFGILVSTKLGQFRMNLAEKVKKDIEASGMAAAILVSNTFDFDSIGNLTEFDVFVNTACPRLVLDDAKRLRKPLLSIEELSMVLDMKKGGK